MLKYFGRLSCPRCAIDLVHECDMANDWVLLDEQRADQRWLCPRCGFSRPVIYAVEREKRLTAVAAGRTTGRRPALTTLS